MNYDARLYWRLRQKGWRARGALRVARTKFAWERAEDADRVRIRSDGDWGFTIDDLAGDMFNPDASPGIQHSRMERERKEFERRVEREGVVYILCEYRDPMTDEWCVGASCGGIIGDDMGWEHGLVDELCAECLNALNNAHAKVHIIARGMCE